MSEGKLYLELITRRRCVFEGYVTKVIVPSKLGEMCILPGHAAMLAVVIPGVFRCKDVKGGESVYAIKGGFVQVQSNRVKVMVERAWDSDELEDPVILEPMPDRLKTLTAPYIENLEVGDDCTFRQLMQLIREAEQRDLAGKDEEAYAVKLINEAKIKVKAGLKDG